jgi:vacuolar-type H+-ATPase subunit E/Vma4
VADAQETADKPLADAADEAGAVVRREVSSIIEAAEARARDIERDAREEADRLRGELAEQAEAASRQASERASREARSIVDAAEARAKAIRGRAQEDAARIRRRASDSSSVVLRRAQARILKQLDAVQRELALLVSGLRRDADSLTTVIDESEAPPEER